MKLCVILPRTFAVILLSQVIRARIVTPAPPVTPKHLWTFTYILNGKIPGDVPLTVHGQTVVRNSFIIFDGFTSWLGATLPSFDCLIAPTMCKDGFAIGFKIKFIDLSKFPEKRYIADTGVLSKGTRGIAVYLQEGQLFCVVMTMTAQWKLGMSVPSNRWAFIGISWSEYQGLHLYNDGRLVTQTKLQIPQNQVPIGRTSPNFVFGRSLAGTGFAKFYLASFSTFNTFLTESAMRPVYTYYWRIGESEDEDTSQPQIEPYYFWSFLTISNGQISGHPPLIVHGHVEVVDGGLYFDGLTAFLSTRLVPSNILVNPDRATEGLAFGIKLKFDGTAKEYDTPKYVLDSGVQSGEETGISFYVLNGKLIAEIATQNMKWKAEINLITDQWLYIIVNWKSSSGLYIALNGFRKSSDRTGSPVTGLEPSPRDPNFCIGRNVGGKGFYYTKFYLASLVVFNEYLSDSLEYPVYLYYR